MRILYTLVFLLAFTNSAWAFSCPAKTLEQKYQEAERVFLIYVTETKLDETLFREMVKGYPAENDKSESVKAIFADYEVVEDFKGDKNYKPILVDLLGIGTGYVGLTPGKYYAILLPPPSKDQPNNLASVNICNTAFEHYRLKVDRFQKELDQIRTIANE